ncbi:MAG: hypothetical protein U0703_18670 [Anaerolineae bacterium]
MIVAVPTLTYPSRRPYPHRRRSRHPACRRSPTLRSRLGVRTDTPPPTQITAAPGTIPAPVTPVEAGFTPQPATVTPLPPLPTLATLPPTALPTIAGVPQNVPDNPQARAFALSASGGAVTGSGFILPFGASTFARNPVDPSHMAVVDTRGLLYMFFGGLTVDNGRVRVSPRRRLRAAERRPESGGASGRSAGRPMGSTRLPGRRAEADDRDGIWYTNNPQRRAGIQYAAQVSRNVFAGADRLHGRSGRRTVRLQQPALRVE